MAERVMIGLRATPGVSWRVLWRCPLCLSHFSVHDGTMWEHLKDQHEWDWAVYEDIRQGNAPKRGR